MDDPSAYFNTFLAAVSGISATIQVMIAQEQRLKSFRIPEHFSKARRSDLPIEYREVLGSLNEEALQAGEAAFEEEKLRESSPQTLSLVRKIPKPVQDAMEANVQRCWNRLVEFISDNNYTPIERETAHRFARQCVCRELSIMLEYLGELPEELQGFWNACNCQTL